MTVCAQSTGRWQSRMACVPAKNGIVSVAVRRRPMRAIAIAVCPARGIRLGICVRSSPASCRAGAGRPRHHSASRTAGSFIVPRGLLLRGGGRQPWSFGLARRSTPRRSRCDGAASGAFETSRQRAGSSTSLRPFGCLSRRPPQRRAHRRGMVLRRSTKENLTWLPSAPSPSVRTAATRAS